MYFENLLRKKEFCTDIFLQLLYISPELVCQVEAPFTATTSWPVSVQINHQYLLRKKEKKKDDR